MTGPTNDRRNQVSLGGIRWWGAARYHSWKDIIQMEIGLTERDNKARIVLRDTTAHVGKLIAIVIGVS